jgi:hypothetical protein
MFNVFRRQEEKEGMKIMKNIVLLWLRLMFTIIISHFDGFLTLSAKSDHRLKKDVSQESALTVKLPPTALSRWTNTCMKVAYRYSCPTFVPQNIIDQSSFLPLTQNTEKNSDEYCSLESAMLPSSLLTSTGSSID